MSRYDGGSGNSHGVSRNPYGASGNPYNSRQPYDQYGGDSSGGYNDYGNDYSAVGRYADNRRLIDNNGASGYSSQNKYSTRYDDLTASRDTNRYSDSLGSRQDPYSRMGGYNDDHDGEHPNNRSSHDTGSRNPYSDPFKDATNRYANRASSSGYENTDIDPDNRYGASSLHSPSDNLAYGDVYRNGGKSFDEVNARYEYALKNDNAARRYKPENEDRYVQEGDAGRSHHHRGRHYYY